MKEKVSQDFDCFFIKQYLLVPVEVRQMILFFAHFYGVVWRKVKLPSAGYTDDLHLGVNSETIGGLPHVLD